MVGAAENTIRILPPLNTSFEEIDLAFLKLKEISQELHKKMTSFFDIKDLSKKDLERIIDDSIDIKKMDVTKYLKIKMF